MHFGSGGRVEGRPAHRTSRLAVSEPTLAASINPTYNYGKADATADQDAVRPGMAMAREPSFPLGSRTEAA
jgi:hypothetical protein